MAGLNHQVHGELDLRIGCALAQSARFFQIIPINMKRAISVRKVTLMIVTVRNTSLAERGFMNASHLAKSREQITQAGKCFGSKRRHALLALFLFWFCQVIPAQGGLLRSRSTSSCAARTRKIGRPRGLVAPSKFCDPPVALPKLHILVVNQSHGALLSFLASSSFAQIRSMRFRIWPSGPMI